MSENQPHSAFERDFIKRDLRVAFPLALCGFELGYWKIQGSRDAKPVQFSLLWGQLWTATLKPEPGFHLSGQGITPSGAVLDMIANGVKRQVETLEARQRALAAEARAWCDGRHPLLEPVLEKP